MVMRRRCTSVGLNAPCDFGDGDRSSCRLWVLVADRPNSYRNRVGDLQRAEITSKLAEHLRRGQLLDLAPDLAVGSPIDKRVMASWDDTHSVAANDVRDLLRGRVVTDPDPRGLCLRAARIHGRLDLDNLNTTIKLTLLDCLLEEGITAEAAHLPGLSLRRCLLTHPSKPALYANDLRTDAGVSFEGSVVIAYCADGAIRMDRTHIGGLLDCSAAIITNVSGPALHGERLKVNDSVFLNAGFAADGAGQLGTVHLSGARIGGNLDCSGAAMSNVSGPALHAEQVHVEGHVRLYSGFTAAGAGELGAVRLSGAHIGGVLNCADATITNPSGPALRAGFLQLGAILNCTGLTANGNGELGAVRLPGAHIGGVLDCSGASITNPSGPALHGERLHIGGDVYLREGFTADGHGELGAVWLLGTHIGGQLDCSGAIVRNSSGPALRAGPVQVTGRIFLCAGFTAHGTGNLGAVHLGGARIGGQLDCSGATICNPSGPALAVNDLQTGGSVLLRDGFTADGNSERGVVRLVGTHINGQLDCSDAIVHSRSGPQHRWALDGLTYKRLPLDPLGKSTTGWLDLFRTGTPAYAAQPYQQLASVYRAAGHDRDVRQILIAQRQAQLDRGVLTRHERLWAKITGLTLGYGYQPWRALLFLLGVVVTSVMLAFILGAHGALIHPQDPTNPTAATTSCSITERINVGLEVGAPLIDTHARDRCITTNTATGIGLNYSTQGLQLLNAILSALFIAGFTGVVRKT
jgi:hypothetical protein